MSIEATEHVGPVIFWRKELRDGSGGAGQFRGGLGQVVEISPTEGHEMHFNAMFDRIDHPHVAARAAITAQPAPCCSTTAPALHPRGASMCRPAAG